MDLRLHEMTYAEIGALIARIEADCGAWRDVALEYRSMVAVGSDDVASRKDLMLLESRVRGLLGGSA